MKHVQKPDKVHLGSMIDSLKKGQYVIPDFQRDFEWEPWDVTELIRSIFMDYYVGTLLLWKGNKENFSVLSVEPIYGFNNKTDPQHIVLDGQQRLTAIYYAFFAPKKPFPKRAKRAVFLINILSLIEEDYENFIRYEFVHTKLKKTLQNKEALFESHTFPLGEMQEGTWGTGDWIKEYRDYWQEKAEATENPIDKETYENYAKGAKNFKIILEELFNDYYISYIELDQEIEVAKVCDIFTQINSRGIRLDIFDLLNAILRPKEIFLKEMWRNAEQELEFMDSKKMKTYVLQVMSVLEQSYCSSKFLYYLVPNSKKTIRNTDGSKEQIVLIKSEDEFINKWNQSVAALRRTIDSLRNPRDYGAIKASFIPYPSIVPAFASIKQYVLETKPSNVLDVNRKIRKWYWASVFTNRYSSSVESTTARDYMSLKKWFVDDNATPDVIKEFVIGLDTLNLKTENYKGSAVYNAIFNLLIINEARDWSTFDLPEYSELDDHHIVPYSVFKDRGGKAINSILNRTPISDETNRHIIRNRMPNDYIREMIDNNGEERVYQVFESHLISRKAVEVLLRKPFEKEDFEEFLDERYRTIKDAIQSQLIDERVVLPANLKQLNDEIEKVELKIRKTIVDLIGEEKSSYTERIPSHILDKVQHRVKSDLRKKPDLFEDDYESLSAKIDFFDLSEYHDIIVSKTNWELFSEIFKSKHDIMIRFNQLSTLRNGIRHSRKVSEIEQMDGEVAIKWFKTVLK